jgi:Na+/citrate or Na+/malate symporter
MAALVPGACARQADTVAEERAIRDLDKKWVQAVAARDTMAIGNTYAEDAEFLPQGAPRVTGRAAIRSAWAQLLKTPNLSLTFEPTKVVTGVLFLLAIFLAPLAGIIPSQATAPALVLVGYLMFTQVKDINVNDIEDGLPALLTMILMPLTYDITVGIGAGFISWVVIKITRGKMSEIHPLMWVVSVAFVIFFLQDWITALLPAK